MSQNLCTPARIYGEFSQTLFMGLSVMSFSASIGWNGQQSEVTIQLVYDPDTCGGTKVYYDSMLNRKTMTGADPGFTSPIVGSPHYFRAGDFEYMGLVQSVERKDAPDGKNIYTVKLVDPTEILAGTQIIVSDYAGTVDGVSNVINAYGFAESFGKRCKLSYVNGSPFGSPADGFGGSESNDNGMPWNIIEQATSMLTSSIPSIMNKFSPNGRLVFRGSAAGDSLYGGVKANQLDLEMPYIFEGHLGYLAHYFVDLSSLPTAPQDYRFSGPSISLLEAITQLCDDAGCDFYVELVPIIIGGQIIKIIKVRVAIRGSQPVLGQIEAFIGNSDGTQSSSVGEELRNEVTSQLIVGEQQDNIYQADDEIAGNALIEPFWGLDSDGNVLEIQENSGYEYIELDISQLNAILHNPLPTTTINLYYLELRAALEGQDSFEAVTSFLGVGPPVVDANCFGAHINTLFGAGGWVGAFNIADLLIGCIGFGIPGAGDMPAGGWEAHNPRRAKVGVRNKDNEELTEDLDTIFNFVADYAKTYYGRKYMVQIPYSCVIRDNVSQTIKSTEVPTESGWSEATTIINLNHPSMTSIFSEDNGKIKCFAKFSVNGSDDKPYDLEQLRNDAFLTFNTPDEGNEGTSTTHLFVGATAEQEIVYTDKDSQYSPRVVCTLSQPIYRRDTEEDSMSPAQLMAWYFLVVVNGQPAADVRRFLNAAIGMELSFMGMVRNAIQPSGFAIPMHSNVLTYGPWSSSGPPGKTNFEKDSSLAPWEYGDSDTMNAAGQSKASTAVTYMQVAETGNIQVPGYPMFNLGQELMSGAASLVETRNIITKKGSFPGNKVRNKGKWNANTNSPTITNGDGREGDYYIVSVAGNTVIDGNSNWQKDDLIIFVNGKWTKQLNIDNVYLQIDDLSNPRWTGLYGPNITNISCEVNSGGISTTYSFRTYTPVTGRFSRLNAERLKASGLRALQIRRAMTLQNISNNIIFNGQHDDVKKAILKSYKTGKPSIKVGGTPSSILCGALIKNASDSNRVYADVGLNKWSHILNECSPDTFAKKAFMSIDGLLRPVSKSGSGGLPRYYQNGLPLPFTQTPEPPVTAYTPKSIGLSTLDPLQNDHDILLLGREDELPEDGLALPFDAYSDDYRFFAFKGPMILQQWGIDTNNKPIPNYADVEADAEQGIFKTWGLTDTFMTDYLKKSKTWPVGPIDLRFDRTRGVWTIPPGYRIVTAVLTQDLAFPAGTTATITDGYPLDDAAGGDAGKDIVVYPISAAQNGVVGDTIMAYYDTTDRKYKIIEIASNSNNPKIRWGTVTGAFYPERASYAQGVLVDAVQVIDIYNGEAVEVVLPKSQDRIHSLYYGNLIAFCETIDGTFVCVSDYSVSRVIFTGTITSNSVAPDFPNFNVLSEDEFGANINYTCVNELKQPVMAGQLGYFTRETSDSTLYNTPHCNLIQAEFACLCVVTDIQIKDYTQGSGGSHEQILFKISDRKIYLESAWTDAKEDSSSLYLDLTVYCCSSGNTSGISDTTISLNMTGLDGIDACLKNNSEDYQFTREGCGTPPGQ